MSASPGNCGALMLPPTATLTYRRLIVPAVQRTPWPKETPAFSVVPWIRTEPTVAFSPAVLKTSVGLESWFEPEPLIEAPPVAPLLLQPRAAPAGGLAHGQASTPPEPGAQTYCAGSSVQPARSIRLAGKPASSKLCGTTGLLPGCA